VSGERARRELGWRPRTSFEEGMRRYVDWHVQANSPAPAPAMAAPSPWRSRARENARRLGWALLFAGAAAVMAAALFFAAVMPWPHAVSHASRPHEAMLALGALASSAAARVAAVRNRPIAGGEDVSRSQA
jgi:UDP-glucose 4-epimerase